MKKTLIRLLSIILLALLAFAGFCYYKGPEGISFLDRLKQGFNTIIENCNCEETDDSLSISEKSKGMMREISGDRYKRIDTRMIPTELTDFCGNYGLFPLRWSGLRSFDIYDEYLISFSDYLEIKENLRKYYEYHISLPDNPFSVENLYIDCGILPYCSERDQYNLSPMYSIKDDDEENNPLFGGYPYVRTLGITCPTEGKFLPLKTGGPMW